MITTRLASNSFMCFATWASFLQHCHAVTVDCGLMDIRTDGLFLSGYKFPLAFPSTLYMAQGVKPPPPPLRTYGPGLGGHPGPPPLFLGRETQKKMN